VTSSRSTGSRRRVVATVGAGAVLLLLATGCSLDDVPNQIGIPDPGTDQGERIFHLWQATWVSLWVVGIITWALILGAAVMYRRRKSGQVPAQTRYNLPIEVMYTITPLIIVAVFTIFTWRDEAVITDIKPDKDLTVNVVGYQWAWTFNYLEGGVVEEPVYETGTPDDPPTLYLPVGEKVEFVLTSPDVIHSFNVPKFLMRMDVVPGRENTFQVTPTVEGTFSGFCVELCGTYHSQMRFEVEVVSPEEFDAQLAEFAELGQTGDLVTGRVNDDAQNQGNTELGGQP